VLLGWALAVNPTHTLNVGLRYWPLERIFAKIAFFMISECMVLINIQNLTGNRGNQH
jgi:hypothetical protein